MKFREFETSSCKKVLAGRNAENNDELVKKFKGKNNLILHTEKPGSPFCVLLEKPDEKDVKETAIFCASRSQDWRNNKKDVRVHVFSGKDVYKKKGMKKGTWGVKRKAKVILVKKIDIKKFENAKRTSVGKL